MSLAGKDAENAAAQYLHDQGLRLLVRNYRTRRGELDLVLMDGGTLVIVEVRMRQHNGFGGALASVDARKRSRIIYATRELLAKKRALANRPVRFDVIAFESTGTLNWVRGAFDAGE